MTGYSRKWTCFICKEEQESIDYPRSPICHACLKPLAQRLCRDALGPKVTLEHPAVNRQHFMTEAAAIGWLLLARKRD